MLKNYIVIALRNLLRHRGYSLLNLAGLAAGLSCCILIILFIREDLSYDTFHERSNRIARVLTIDNAQGVSSQLVGVSYPPLGPALVQELPEIVSQVRVAVQGRPQFSYGDKVIKAENALLTESSFFDVFSFPLLRGVRKGVLDEPRSVVLTESFARKIFGSEDPIGKTLLFNKTIPLAVKGVMSDPPPNSHLQFDMLQSLKPPDGQPGWQQWITSWSGISLTTYVLLDRPRDVKLLNPKLKSVADKNGGYRYFTPVLQPLQDVHLQSANILFEENSNKGEISNLYTLSAVALFIILLASINFMNLVTARSALRAREVGMRKVMGATRQELILQHLCESLVITAAAFVLAIGLVELLLPVLNTMYGRHASFTLYSDPVLAGSLLLLLLTVGLLAGSYPAFVLSSFEPTVVLKGSFNTGRRGIVLRRVLVVFQFAVSIALIASTGIVLQQMSYIRTKDLGYSREQIVSIPISGVETFGRLQALRTELERNPAILATATSRNQIGNQLGRMGITPEGASANDNYIVSLAVFDDQYIPTMGMTIKQGRNFSKEFPSDTSDAILINETMAAMMKWSDPIGKKISLEGAPGQPLPMYTVVGVVRDFHFATMRHKVEPLVMLYSRSNEVLSVKISTGNVPQTIAFIERTWKKINPQELMSYSFLDDDYNKLYNREEAFATMTGHFTGLAIFIAGLGLFGLSAFSVQQRKKEIGVRKVLGASVQTITLLLGTEFLRWVALANLFAWPAAYLFMQSWLNEFEYRVDIDPWPFVSATVLSLLIATLTVSWQSIRAAVSNPVKSLRYE